MAVSIFFSRAFMEKWSFVNSARNSASSIFMVAMDVA